MPEQICPHCGESHQLDALFCPVTGHPLDILSTTNDRRRRNNLIWIFAVVLIVGVVGGFFGSWRRSSSRPTPTQPVIIAVVETISPTLNSMPATPSVMYTVTPTQFMVTTNSTSTTATPTSTPRPSFTVTMTATDDSWQACRNTYPSRLRISDQAYVSFDPPYPNNVREDPNMDAEVIGQIDPGEEILVLEGPACSNQWVWWLIRSRKTGLVGWTAEGDIENYWLMPLPEK